MKPQLAAIAREHGDKVVILLVDVRRHSDMAVKAGVRGIPDSRLMRGGRQLERVVGGYPKEHFTGLVKKHARSLPVPQTVPVRTPPTTKQGQSSSGGSIKPMNDSWLPPGVSPAGE